MNWPTPALPLILTFPPHGKKAIPSLKNNRELIPIDATRMKSIKNAEVQAYLRKVGPLISEQWQQQASQYGWSLLPKPTLVAVAVRVVLYRPNPKKLPRQDGDNIYTTLQETLQKLVIEDDNQVADHHVRTQYTRNRALHHATLCLWVVENLEEEYMERDYRLVIDNHMLVRPTPTIRSMPDIPFVDSEPGS